MAINRKQNSVKELPAVEILRNLAYLAPLFSFLLLIYIMNMFTSIPFRIYYHKNQGIQHLLTYIR